MGKASVHSWSKPSPGMVTRSTTSRCVGRSGANGKAGLNSDRSERTTPTSPIEPKSMVAVSGTPVAKLPRHVLSV